MVVAAVQKWQGLRQGRQCIGEGYGGEVSIREGRGGALESGAKRLQRGGRNYTQRRGGRGGKRGGLAGAVSIDSGGGRR